MKTSVLGRKEPIQEIDVEKWCGFTSRISKQNAKHRNQQNKAEWKFSWGSKRVWASHQKVEAVTSENEGHRASERWKSLSIKFGSTANSRHHWSLHFGAGYYSKWRSPPVATREIKRFTLAEDREINFGKKFWNFEFIQSLPEQFVRMMLWGMRNLWDQQIRRNL